jgi:HD-GYP domain-containing protein (c-di-GMP phosphodiesterase class II)
MTNAMPLNACPDRFLYPPPDLREAAPFADAPWDSLEQLVRELQTREEEGGAGLRSLLRTVHAGTRADVVFLFDPVEREVLAVEAEGAVDPVSCRDLAERAFRAAGDPGDRPRVADLPGGDGPGSLAVVRVGKSRKAWLFAVRRRPGRPFGRQDLRVMALANEMVGGHRHQVRLYARLQESLVEMIHCLTAALDAKDAYTCGHSERVARIAVRLGRQMGLGERASGDLYLGGLLHDVGKIGVRDSVLLKESRLTEAEYEHVKQHTLIGDRIVSRVKQLGHLRPAVRSHHERYDGRGYPDGLAGEAIPLSARVLAVADACDAMMSSRPYRPAVAPADIDTILANGAGTHWDPAVVGHFLACRDELYVVCQRGIGDSLYAAVGRPAEHGGPGAD